MSEKHIIPFKFGDFQLDIPKDWTLSSIILTGPNPSRKDLPQTKFRTLSFRKNLVFTSERVDNEVTADSYLQKQAKGLIDAGVQHKSIILEEVFLENNIRGILTEQLVIGPGGEYVQQMQLVCVNNGMAYTLVTSDLAGEPYEKAKEEFKELLLSFSIP